MVILITLNLFYLNMYKVEFSVKEMIYFNLFVSGNSIQIKTSAKYSSFTYTIAFRFESRSCMKIVSHGKCGPV